MIRTGDSMELAMLSKKYQNMIKTTPDFASSVSFCFPINVRVKTISTNSARPRRPTHALGLSREIFALLTEIPLPGWVSSISI